jgi:hypothetical protein
MYASASFPQKIAQQIAVDDCNRKPVRGQHAASMPGGPERGSYVKAAVFSQCAPRLPIAKNQHEREHPKYQQIDAWGHLRWSAQMCPDRCADESEHRRDDA